MTLFKPLFYVFSIYIKFTSAGQCISRCRDPNDCPPGRPLSSETPPIWQTCPSGPVDGAQWACQASNIDFPTVECIAADMITCGLMAQGDRSTVFYSFGASTAKVRQKFRDTLNPKGVMFNDALDDGYWNSVLNVPKFGLDDVERSGVFVARYAEAMAAISTGEVFLVVKRYKGEGGGRGAYQMPLPGGSARNVWRLYEFPTLQRNPAVTRVTSIDLSHSVNRHVDWTPNSGYAELPASDASDLPLPPLLPNCPTKVKRQAAKCVTCITFAPPGGTTGTISVSATGSVTAPAINNNITAATTTTVPTISCSLQHEDPDQGINTQYCVCSSSTFPVLSVGPTVYSPDASCAYNALPSASALHPTAALPVMTSNCRACSVGYDFEQCKPVPDCTLTLTTASTVVVATSSASSSPLQRN